MFDQLALPRPTLRVGFGEKALALLVILSLLLQPLLMIQPTVTRSAQRSATNENIDAVKLTSSAPVALPYNLPAELADKPDVPALRTLDSATFDLGNGQFARFQDAQPLHYQDGAGAWQRINPAFQQVGGRWINSTNTVRTAVDAANRTATVNAAGVALQWQPQALEFVDTNGAHYPLVRAKTSAVAIRDGAPDAVRYQAGWTAAPVALPFFDLGTATAIEDQWQSRPGSTEYTVRLAERPTLRSWQATPEALDLRVQVSLAAGTMLLVNGAPVDFANDTPLVTQDELIFVDAQGQELILHAPSTYEQADRDQMVQASYIVVPTQPATRNPQHGGNHATRNTFQLHVRTPWSWLAAPDRHFPVIIDPLFQMRAPYLAAEAYYKPSTPGAPYTYDHLSYVSDRIYLGRSDGFGYRAALRFDLPLMPAGTQIDRAWLYAVPSDFKLVNRSFDVTMPGRLDQIAAYAIQDDNWINGAEPTVDLNAPLSSANQWIAYNSGQEKQQGVKWDVTDLAKSWLLTHGQIQPVNQNHGILLRLKNEFCDPDGVIFLLETFMCGGFLFDIGRDAWSLADDLVPTQTNALADDPPLLPSESGGIRLVLFYHNNSVLTEGANPFFFERSANRLPQSGDKNPPYYEALHRFHVANPPARWQAVVARGLAKPVGPVNPTQPGVANSYRVPLTGTVSLDLRSSTSEFLATSLSKATGENGKVSYLLLDGRGTPYAGSQVSGQLPLNVAYSPPPNTPDNGVIGYDIRLLGETGSINVATGVKQTIGYTFDSADPLAVWNLQLPSGTNAAVRIGLTGDGTGPEQYRLRYGNQFEAKIVGATSQGDVRTSNPADNSGGPNPVPLDANYAVSLDVDDVQPQDHALVIRYNGPKLVAYDEIACPEICPKEEIPIKYNLSIEVLACPAGTFPTNSGRCQTVECPSLTDLAMNYRETADYGVWSKAGWSSANEANPVASQIGASAPLIGPRRVGSQYRAMTVALIGGKITYAKTDGALTISSETTEAQPAKVRLIACPTPGNSTMTYSKSFGLFAGVMRHTSAANGAGFRPEATGNRQFLADPWPSGDRQGGDLTLENLVVEPNANGQFFSTATGSARLRRVMGQSTMTIEYFNTTWSLTVDGWPSLSSTVTPLSSNPSGPSLASLILRLGTQLELDTSPNGDGNARLFIALRAKAGTVQQPAKLGSAKETVQMVVLPRGVPLPALDLLCPASCLDLRGPTDAANGPLDRAWAMPDVHTNVDANTVLMNAAGVMEVYSTDHPTLMNGTDDAFSKEFSFDAYKATVTVDYAQCGGVGPEVLIIKGETSMALPNIGNVGTGGLIAAGFTLCETSLRSVRFNFEAPVGLPIGSSGLFLTGLRGEVSIYPDYTQIKVGLNFQAAPGGDGGIFKAWGEVTIDTRGLFEFGGGGKVLGVVNADGKLWVAWNPLDTGFELNVRLGSWFHGFARAHMWQGQGWQNRYSWLPDNDAMHFAGEIGATITIEESAVMWLVPPGDINIGIEVAFGEFCTNNSCTQYEWGIKGKVIIVGYDVGIYYGFEEGLDFILGNDDHLLIDEYGGQVVSAAAMNGLKTMAAPQKVNGAATIPFTVSPNAEQILVGLSWQAGAPTLSLINPDGVEITVGNVASHNGATDGNANITLFGLQQPKAGAWQAKLSNLSEAGVEHYRFLYFANKGAPGPVGDHGHFLTPANANEPGTNSYTISWVAPADTGDKATISLFYARTLTNSEALSQTGIITGNLLLGAPIVQNLPFKTGSFQWNTTGLLNGEYRIRAVVDDGVNELPAGQVSLPNDMCTPQPNGLPTARAFDPERFPGTVRFAGTGSILINDTTPPALPTGLKVTPADRALLVEWDAVVDPDVRSYIVRWGKRNPVIPGTFIVTNQTLVAAPNGARPQLYLGAVENGFDYGVDLTALDSNGNASAQTAPVFAKPEGSSAPVPLQPTNLTLTGRDSTSATFTWQPNPLGPTPASYELTFVKLLDGAVVGSHVVNGTSATIPNLQTGAVYDVQVTARSADGWRSLATAPVRVVISNGVDGNGDGLPDDWAAAHHVTNGAADSDGDGLTNTEEYAQGSDPNNQDSDNDDASDGEEQTAGTDPLDGSEFSNLYTQPRLALERNTLHFTAKLQNGGEAAPKLVGWSNVGGGTLQLQAASADSWIQPSIVNDKVLVALNTTGLSAGFHSGVVRLQAAPGSDPLIADETWGGSCIRVNTWVLPADDDTSSGPVLDKVIYLPIVSR